MAQVTLRNHTIEVLPIRDSFSRRALQLRNKIVQALKALGIPEDDVDINEEKVPMRKSPAEVSWYSDGFFCHFSHAKQNNYAENLAAILRVLELETAAVIAGTKPRETFLNEFSEDHDIKGLRKEARETLGVEDGCMDLGTIDLKYKRLAKAHHPDMPNGDEMQFKRLNSAHKILRKELE